VLASETSGRPPAVESVSDREAEQALERFARAYASEDGTALAALLTSDVKRVLPGEVQRGRAPVVAAYRRQFASSTVRAFEVGDVETDSGPAGRAEARYTVRRRGAGAFSGRIVLGVVNERGRVRVRLIASTPD
jgi:hypothetical protein